jgi:hypothetical protein
LGRGTIVAACEENKAVVQSGIAATNVRCSHEEFKEV